MKLIVAIIVSCYACLAMSQNLPRPEERPFISPYQARLARGRKHVDVAGNKNRASENVGLDAQRKKASMTFGNDPRKYGAAGESGNFGQAIAPGTNRRGGKDRASATKFGRHGGAGTAGNVRGLTRNRVDANGNQHADLTANGRTKLDTSANKNGQSRVQDFKATGTRHAWETKPNGATTNQKGDGVFRVSDNRKASKDEFYLYEYKKQGRQDYDAQIAEPQNKNQGGSVGSLLGRQSTKYRCKAAKVGESICYDQHGRQAGKVVADRQGNVVVYNKQNIPVSRGKCTPRPGGGYNCNVNNNFLKATVERYQEFDCMRDYGLPGNKKVKIQKPLLFKHKETRAADGSRVINWPDCFDMGATVKFQGFTPAELQDIGKRSAMEIVANVLPAGRLRCVDPGTCGRDCYYCDFCKPSNKQHKMDILDNVNVNELCAVNSQQTVRLKATVCPPPKSFEWAQCTGFTKKFNDPYWKKKGDIHGEIRIYLRPKSQAQLETECMNKVNNPIQKFAVQAAYLTAQAKDVNLGRASNSDLYQFCVRDAISKQGVTGRGYDKTKGQMVACRRGITSYNLDGKDGKATRILIESASAGSNPNQLGSFFKNAKCPKFQKLQEDQYNADLAQHRASQGSSTGGGGFLGGLGGLGGGTSTGGGLGGFGSLFGG
jgi:hypothetical protein